MLRFFARWFFRAALIAIFGTAFFSHGSFGTIVAWAVCGYLLWRALPAVRKDFHKIWRFGKRRFGYTNARF